jgi:hypothetical protein
MLARPAPANGDVVVRPQQREGTLVYVLHTPPGPDQFLLRTREEAFAKALTFAERARVRAWVASGESSFALLGQPKGPSTEDRPLSAMVARLRAEYLEMPGLRLKAEQVQRLCGIEPMSCQSALAALVDANFLRVTPGGHYARVTDARDSRSRCHEGRP